ncbi:MAG: bifunctional serine/threonine-protein kinase/formylglycine-generating enzyme family protein [Minicystis sp.]
MSDAGADPFGWEGVTIEGKYRVDEVVGEGGFGVVYRGHHLGFDEPIAIKVLKVPASFQGEEREAFLKTFLAEGKLLHRLSRGTAGIVQALDVGAAVAPNGAWTPYLVLEWLRGITLERDLIDRRKRGESPRSVGEAIALLEPAARALAAAHAQGIAHRDVKPANLFLAQIAERTTLKVLDFGIAKVLSEVSNLTQAMAETGGSVRSFTPQYGAPEQFHRKFGATGPWTDVFALALVLVEIVAGRLALEGSDTTQLYILSTDPTSRPTLRSSGIVVEDAIEQVISKALSVEPRARYLEAGAFWDALLAASPKDSAAGEARRDTRISGPSVALEELASMATGQFLEIAATNPPSPATGPSAPSTIVGAQTIVGAATVATAAPASAAQPEAPRDLPSPSTTGAPVIRAPEPALDAGPLLQPTARAPAGKGSGGIIVGAAIAVLAAAGGAGFLLFTAKAPAPPPPNVERTASAPVESAKPPAVDPNARVALVPAGKFMMGTTLGGKTEGPPHEVTLTHAFELDLYEVTAGEYATCVSAGKCSAARPHGAHMDEAQVAKFAAGCTSADPAKARFAVNCVDQAQASAYCAFVGKRLPTEAEWEYAARGTDGRDFPWGTSPPSCDRGNFSRPLGESCGGRARGPIEVGTLPMGKSAWGAFDMAGNVWEWVADGWAPQAYAQGAQKDPKFPFVGDKGVMRGGSWDYDAGTSRSTFRFAFESTSGHVGTGFRCVKTVE